MLEFRFLADRLTGPASGGPDDFLRFRTDGTIYSHTSENHAVIFYCPPGVIGLDCSFGFGIPGRKAWSGQGQWNVNSEINTSFEFTCPSVIIGRGTVTDPDSGDLYSIRTRMVRVVSRQGTCRDIQNEIDVEPVKRD